MCGLVPDQKVPFSCLRVPVNLFLQTVWHDPPLTRVFSYAFPRNDKITDYFEDDNAHISPSRDEEVFMRHINHTVNQIQTSGCYYANRFETR